MSQDCYETAEDALLAAWAGAGDDAALETLFRRYRKVLYAYFNRILNHDTMSADDLFQELWIRIIRSLPKYRESGKFSAWMFRIAHNLALEHFRKLKIRSRIGSSTSDGELPDHPGDTPEPGSVLEGKDLAERLEQLLLELPEEQREVFHFRQNGMSFKEIAAIQGCPLNTALGRMHNVMKFLQHRLTAD